MSEKHYCPITGEEVEKAVLESSKTAQELLSSGEKPTDYNEYFSIYGNTVIKKKFEIEKERDWEYIDSLSANEHRRTEPFLPDAPIFFEK